MLKDTAVAIALTTRPSASSELENSIKDINSAENWTLKFLILILPVVPKIIEKALHK